MSRKQTKKIISKVLMGKLDYKTALKLVDKNYAAFFTERLKNLINKYKSKYGDDYSGPEIE